MNSVALIFTIFLCVVHLSKQYDYEYSEYTEYVDTSNEESLSTTTTRPLPTKVTNIIADENTDAFLICESKRENEYVAWIRTGIRLQTDERTSLAIHEGIATVTIKNVTANDSGHYLCQKSKFDELFYLNVTVPNISFTNGAHIYIRSGGTIDLTCTITSVQSFETVIWKLNDTVTEPHQTVWRTKARKCATEEMELCRVLTTFGLTIKNAGLSNSGNYTCSTSVHTIDAAKIYVQVIHHPVITERNNMPESWENQIIEFATDALEMHGLSQHVAEYVREKCQSILSQREWNCIVGEEFHAQALSPRSFQSDYSSINFSLGSIHFLVFQSYYY